MAWRDDLLDASFRGVKFPIQGISDRGEKSLVVHEYPYRPGAEVEDMGRKARRIPVKAVFWGENYLSPLQELVKALEEPGKGELIHPVFGCVDVSIASWDIEHEDERPDYATLTFEAVETGLDNPFFAARSNRSRAERARLRMGGGLAAALAAGAHALTLALAEAALLPLLAQAALLEHLHVLLDAYDAGRAVVRTALSYIEYPMAFISDLAAVQYVALGAVGGVVGTFQDFGQVSGGYPRLPLLPGDARYAYNSGAGDYSDAWVSGSVLGRADPVLAVRRERNARPWPTPLPGSGRTLQGAATAYAMLAQTDIMAQAAQGILLAQLNAPSLTPQEVECITGQTRQRMQDSMDYARAAYPQQAVYAVCEGMRDAAEAMQTLGAAAVRAHPPLIRHTTSEHLNFHLLAHQLYGDYTRADELRRLNPQVRNPNFLAAGQELLIYAR